MTEKQSWRPPLAPKPSSGILQTTIPAETVASPAVRGAASAFSPPSSKNANPTQISSNSAVRAAAAAGKARSQQTQKDAIAPRTSVSPVRGRSQLSIDLQRAAAALPSASPAPVNRSTSAIAARAASANTSPVRGGPNQVLLQPSRSRDSSVLSARRQNSNTSQGSDAMSIAAASVSASASPNSKARGPLSQNTGKLDFTRMPALGQPSPAAQSRQLASTSAARAASRGAAAQSVPPVTTFTHPLSTLDSPREMSPEAESNSTITSPSPSIHVSPPQPHLKEDDYFRNRFGSDSGVIERAVPIPIPTSRPMRPSPQSTTQTQPPEPKDVRSGMTASSLADAMVGASLASSRAQSPAKARTKPPPVPRRRSRSVAALDTRSQTDIPSKTSPLPVRPMKHTLRKQSPGHTEDEETKRGRKHWVRKHPNKHHEGDRKRWRDKVTERERKRFEGVWAANRGLLWEKEADRTGLPEQDLVLNIVVRDIWDRSRLPKDVLEEVWDLVSPEDSKYLSREAFVVGLWLIDQRLKGRKLPVKVSASVWSSVRHTQGVKISNKAL